MLGIIGKKLGMSRIYTEKGVVVPVTLIQIYDCVVSEIQEFEDKNYNNIILGFDKPKNENKLNKSIVGDYKKKGLEPQKKKLAVRVSKDSSVKVGDILRADYLNGTTNVDVTGVSKGKGFAGGIKRHHFQGMPASHGHSLSHRSIGSTGNRMSPAKVFKGKKMPGHLGDLQTTIKNLKIIEINPEDNVIAVKGAIPGGKNGDVVIKTVRR
ncbi:MAG: 50S ribosomal protein L3 [Rickettsiales bacterium]|jgi:large subunit ribosomal protein L3|nr:50S ribosomal protein L3 [Rickettsiales bacterium]